MFPVERAKMELSVLSTHKMMKYAKVAYQFQLSEMLIYNHGILWQEETAAVQ